MHGGVNKFDGRFAMRVVASLRMAATGSDMARAISKRKPSQLRALLTTKPQGRKPLNLRTRLKSQGA